MWCTWDVSWDTKPATIGCIALAHAKQQTGAKPPGGVPFCEMICTAGG